MTEDDGAAARDAKSQTDSQRADGDSIEQKRTPLGGGFRLLWTSSGLSNLADGILKVALPLLAIRFTDSPTLIAGLAFALTLPWLLFALPGRCTGRPGRPAARDGARQHVARGSAGRVGGRDRGRCRLDLGALRRGVLHRRRGDDLRHVGPVDPSAGRDASTTAPGQRAAVRRRDDHQRVHRTAAGRAAGHGRRGHRVRDAGRVVGGRGRRPPAGPRVVSGRAHASAPRFGPTSPRACTSSGDTDCCARWP